MPVAYVALKPIPYDRFGLGHYSAGLAAPPLLGGGRCVCYHHAFRQTIGVERDAPLGLNPNFREVEQPFDLLAAEREMPLAHEGLAVKV